MMGKRQHDFRTSRSDRTHDEAMRIHACIRLRERYGIHDVLDQRLAYERHLTACATGRAELVGTRVEDGSLIMAVDDAGRRFYIAWDPNLRAIATYLLESHAQCHRSRT